MKVLYKSQLYTSYQCDKSRSFFVDFNGKLVKFSFCQLLALREQVRKIDLDAHFYSTGHPGIEILMLCNREHIFILDTSEVVDLRNLISATFIMMELNSMVTALKSTAF